MTEEADVNARLGFDRPHTARMYDYYLGGMTNYRVDRETAAETLAAYPNAVVAARQNRAFMHRAVRCLVDTTDIRQFLDIGTGVPTEPNLHQVAQSGDPAAKVVYTDNDPIVLTYARALLRGTTEGSTEYVEADVRDPEKILGHAREHLDFSQPVALSVIALFHFLDDEDDPVGLTRHLMDALPPGSALVLSHGTLDLDPGSQRLLDVYNSKGVTTRFRTKAEVGAFFEGLDLLAPGIVPTCDWRPELTADGMAQLPGMVDPSEVIVYAGVGLKPA